MRYRTLGGLRVSAVGLGAMPLSIEGRPDEERALATVHAALDAGVTLLDTADSYHLPGAEPGHNERLVARALAAYGGDTSDVLVATKGGRGRPAGGDWTVNGSPRHLKAAAEASRDRLGVEAIGLYQLHRPDPTVPFEESVGALRELLDAGTIRLAGLSNADADQIRRARKILGDRLVSVQNRYSPPSGTVSRSCGCARNWGWRSCRGARSADCPAAPWTGRRARRGRSASPRSTRWRRSAVSVPNRSAWPGCWPAPRRSSRSRGRPGRTRSGTRRPRRTCCSPRRRRPG